MRVTKADDTRVNSGAGTSTEYSYEYITGRKGKYWNCDGPFEIEDPQHGDLRHKTMKQWDIPFVLPGFASSPFGDRHYLT